MKKKFNFKIIIAICVIYAVINVAAAIVSMNMNGNGQSDEAVVTAMFTAYQQGNVEEFMKYICEDNNLKYLMAGVGSNSTGDMMEVYKKVHELTKNVEFTAKSVEGRERWGEVEVTMKNVNVGASVAAMMNSVIQEQVKTAGNEFADVPSWIVTILSEEQQPFEKTFNINVGCSEGNEKLDTNTNREFFNALCGYYYEYIDLTLTTCTQAGDKYEIFSCGDEIYGMVQTNEEAYEGGVTKENAAEAIAAYAATYANEEGIYAGGIAQDANILSTFGVDFNVANSNTLYEMGIVSERDTAGYTGYLSLASTISGFESSGMTCETTDFGSGVLADKEEK